MDKQLAGDDTIWIACIPKIPGATRPASAVALARCHKCQWRIWIAPSTIEVLLCRADLARTICIPCWVTHMKENPDQWKDFRIAVTERQDAEVQLHAGVTVEEAVEKIFGITPEMLDLKGRS